MDANKRKVYEEARKQGYSEQEIDSYLTSKGKNLKEYKLSTGQKIGKTVADVLPGVMSGTGALVGGAVGSVIPVAGTTTGAVAGGAGGYGTGLAVKSGIYDLMGISSGKTAKEQAIESVAGPALAGASVVGAGLATRGINAVTKPVTSYVGRAIARPGGIIEKIKGLSPGVNLGELEKEVAAKGPKSEVSRELFENEAKNIFKSMKLPTSKTSMQAKKELSKMLLGTPEDTLDALLSRRGVDKIIKRDLFGRAKRTGENIAADVYRKTLDKVVKQDATLRSIDKALSIYYGVKDPLVGMLTNKLVIGGAATVGAINLLMGKKKD
jgi:hypothetical protein